MVSVHQGPNFLDKLDIYFTNLADFVKISGHETMAFRNGTFATQRQIRRATKRPNFWLCSKERTRIREYARANRSHMPQLQVRRDGPADILPRRKYRPYAFPSGMATAYAL